MFTNEILSAHHHIDKLLQFESVTVARNDKKRIDINAVYNQLLAKSCENAIAICIGLLASDVTRFVTKSVFQKLCDSKKAGYNAIENAKRRKDENAVIFRNRLTSIDYVCEYPQKAFEVYFSHNSDLLESAQTAITTAVYCMPFSSPFIDIDHLYKVACKAVNATIYDEKRYCDNTISDDEKLYNVAMTVDKIVEIGCKYFYDEFISKLKIELTTTQYEILCLRYDEGFTMSQIREIKGYKSNGGIVTALKGIQTKARQILSDMNVEIKY